jgi:hypothetical protein
MATRGRQNLYLSTSLMCFLLAVTFKFDLLGTHWLWAGRSEVAILLVVLGAVLGILWFGARSVT